MPNPVVNNNLRFTITVLQVRQKAEISVIDLGGRTMLKTTASTLLNNNIDISKLSSGMYKLIDKINNGTVLQEGFSK
jgi:AICAR transformylase/IMP cyclohydrolase PurH